MEIVSHELEVQAAYLAGRQQTAKEFAETMPFERVQQGQTAELILTTADDAEGQAQRERAAIGCGSCVLRLSRRCTTMIGAPVLETTTGGAVEIRASINAPDGTHLTGERRLVVTPDESREGQYSLQEAAQMMGISLGTLINWRRRSAVEYSRGTDGREHLLTIAQMDAMLIPRRHKPVDRPRPQVANCVSVQKTSKM